MKPHAVALALALLLLVTSLPLAGAEHVYSHRFMMEGRLVGSDGLPLPGKTVEFYARGDDFLEPCDNQPHQPTTNQWGDFRFCFHKHDLDTSTIVGVRAGNASIEKPMDTAFRRSIVTLRDPDTTGTAPPEWNETYRISGRAWQPGETDLEGVHVYGLAVAHEPLNVTVRTSDGEKRFTSSTDAYGDFDLEIITAEPPGDVRVTLEAAGGARVTARLDPATHRTTVPLYFPAGDDDLLRSQFPGEGGANAPRPGSASPQITPALLVAGALAILAALALAKRKNEQNEDE